MLAGPVLAPRIIAIDNAMGVAYDGIRRQLGGSRGEMFKRFTLFDADDLSGNFVRIISK